MTLPLTKARLKSFWLFDIGLASIAAMTVTMAHCSPQDWLHKNNYELTGTVIDEDTKQPIEGAFVMAEYMETDSNLFVSATYCVKTKGMTTGKDGKYHFPVEKEDGLSPRQAVNAIKSGYYFSRLDLLSSTKSDREKYANRDIYLRKQDAAKPNFNLGPAKICGRPQSRAAASANIEYIKLERAEYERYGAGKDAIDLQGRRIADLESSAESAEAKKKVIQ